MLAALVGSTADAGVVAGVFTSAGQTATGLQDGGLQAAVRLLAVCVAVIVLGHWMLGQLVGLARFVFSSLPAVLG